MKYRRPTGRFYYLFININVDRYFFLSVYFSCKKQNRSNTMTQNYRVLIPLNKIASCLMGTK